MNKIMIKIKTRQEIKGPMAETTPEELVELLTEGKQYKKNNAIYIIYEETELSGSPGCVTSVKIEGEKISLKRYGAPAQDMCFEKGKRYLGMYDTPIGPVGMEIMTNSVVNQLVNDGTAGMLTIDYDISLKGLLESHNVLEMKVAKVKDKPKS